jgi:hypothetical protein
MQSIWSNVLGFRIISSRKHIIFMLFFWFFLSWTLKKLVRASVQVFSGWTTEPVWFLKLCLQPIAGDEPLGVGRWEAPSHDSTKGLPQEVEEEEGRQSTSRGKGRPDGDENPLLRKSSPKPMHGIDRWSSKGHRGRARSCSRTGGVCWPSRRTLRDLTMLIQAWAREANFPPPLTSTEGRRRGSCSQRSKHQRNRDRSRRIPQIKIQGRAGLELIWRQRLGDLEKQPGAPRPCYLRDLPGPTIAAARRHRWGTTRRASAKHQHGEET